MYALLCDSTCDLPPERAAALGLHVVPLNVLMGGREYLDWENVDPDEVYELQRAGGQVSTEPVATERLRAAYAELLQTHDGVLSVHLSGRLSHTAEHAHRAAKFFGNRVMVVDSGLASVALSEAVLRAREVMNSGGDLADARAAVRQVASTGHCEFSVPGLEYLRRSGRISRVQEVMGNLARLRPVIGFAEGELKVLRRENAARALPSMIDSLEGRFGREPVAVAVAHAGRNPERLNELRAAMQASKLNIVRGRMQLIGPVIGAHTGPGLYGLMAVPA